LGKVLNNSNAYIGGRGTREYMTASISLGTNYIILITYGSNSLM
jgi:hypothetical protein